MSDNDIIRDFSSNNTYTWSPWVMRAYNLTVVTRDLAGVNPNALITSPIVNITIKPSLTVNSVNGTVSKSPNLALYNYGTVVRLTANPAPNYHFIGWSGSQSSIYNPLDITMNGNKTITANYAAGPAPVGLGTAGNFAILAKTGISTTGTTAILGNIGVSPAALTYITGFSQTLDPSTTYATSIYVTGKIYAADMTSPTSSNLTTAISDMETAYTDAAGRPTPDFIELGTGDISGMTLAPGLYKWSSGVSVNSDVTLAGGPNAVWIFQIAGNLAIADGKSIHLSGGAQDKNIFWQVAGETILGTGTDLEGIVLCKTAIAMRTGAVMNGRALAQTAVTLDSNDVTKPD
jgi:hypothetical protein